MNPRQLMQFLAVCRHGSMSAAARELHIAQPSLSKQMSMLEHSLEVRLFRRHSRGVSLTNAGAMLRIEAAEIIRKIDALKGNLKGQGAQISGEVTVAIITSLVPAIGVEVYQQLEKEHPDIKLNIISVPSDVASSILLQHEVELAILPNAGTDLPTARSIPLMEEDFFLMGQPGFAPATATVAFSTIGSRVLAMPRSGHDMRRRVEEVARNTGATLNVKYESENINLLGALIEAGLACGIQPISYWLNQISAGKLEAQRIVSPTIARVHSLCWLPSLALSPAAEAVRDLIVAEVHVMISSGKLSERQPRPTDWTCSACASDSPDHITDVICNQQTIVWPDGDADWPSVRVLFVGSQEAAENVMGWTQWPTMNHTLGTLKSEFLNALFITFGVDNSDFLAECR